VTCLNRRWVFIERDDQLYVRPVNNKEAA
jgi:hypothetical protein